MESTYHPPLLWMNIAHSLEAKPFILTSSALNSDFAPFKSSIVPRITIADYVCRIYKYAKCSDSCLLVSVIYIDRLLEKNAHVLLTRFHIHRLLITSVLVAVKFCDDLYLSNKHYAKIGGIKCSELNQMESRFLQLIAYDLHVLPEMYEEYLGKMLSQESYGSESAEDAKTDFSV
eukprot:TRINITY_DN2396_c0_g1_i1.p1 TRINITY_DN2396_c0_g1~~TRINITY_DN2396_c0_g1_i1.p1  ORF type:complete len:175 (+),score=12.35 TRINITY_DN2396_c0_g1_i1:69-593(+)